MAKRFGLVHDMDEWRKPKLVSAAAGLLETELMRLQAKEGTAQNIQFCFTTDPFMYRQTEICITSLECIRICNFNGFPVTVLTKGILPLSLSGLDPRNRYGITCVSEDNRFCEEYEPGAAPLEERKKALMELNKNGSKTWISLEPYPVPEMTGKSETEMIDGVKRIISFFAQQGTDRFIFGRIHYRKICQNKKSIDAYYNCCADAALAACAEYGAECIIKKGTRIK